MIANVSVFSTTITELSIPAPTQQADNWYATVIYYRGAKDSICKIWYRGNKARLHAISNIDDKIKNTERREAIKKFSRDCMPDSPQTAFIAIV